MHEQNEIMDENVEISIDTAKDTVEEPSKLAPLCEKRVSKHHGKRKSSLTSL